MGDHLASNARTSASTARNRGPILDVLRSCLPDGGFVLEIAAGAGEHAVHNAAAFPGLQWQPTDPEPTARASIAAWRDQAALPNLLSPLALDASDPDSWPISEADVIININMVHISPWSATEGLMTGAGRYLNAGGILFLYGPYFERDVDPAPSNLAFHHALQARNPAWGLRWLEDVIALAAHHGLEMSERVEMPANNLSLLFRKI